jgi:hypothetical protein
MNQGSSPLITRSRLSKEPGPPLRLHEELLPIGDHRQELLFRECLVGREIVVKKRNDVVTGSLDVGDDVIDRSGPEAVAVDVSRRAEREQAWVQPLVALMGLSGKYREVPRKTSLGLFNLTGATPIRKSL